MRLALINFEMDGLSDVLAYQCRVARELARHVEFLLVFTEKRGEYESSENMQVELIPSRPMGLPRKLGSGWLYNASALRLMRKHRIDACFIHMNARWTYLLKPTLAAQGIAPVLWYCHGSVTWRLRLAARCARRIVTASPESCRVTPEKVHCIGHGIDTDLFQPAQKAQDANELLYIGRISPRKRQDLLIDTMAAMPARQNGTAVRLRLVGPPLTSADQHFDRTLRARVWNENLEELVRFDSFVPMQHMPRLYRHAFAQINVSQTNSVDKGVLEALACGVPVLTSNVAFFNLLEQAGLGELIIRDERPKAIADQILALHARRADYPPDRLRELIVGHYDLRTYVQRILQHLRESMT